MTKQNRTNHMRSRLARTVASTIVIAITLTLCPTADAQNDGPTLDELLNLPTKKNIQPGNSDRKTNTSPKIDPQLEQTPLGSEVSELFKSAVNEMREASGKIENDQNLSRETQRIQESILSKLDQIIAAVERQNSKQKQKASQSSKQQGSSGNAKQNGSQQGKGKSQTARNGQPNNGSPTNGSVGEVNQGGALRESRKEWGNLPTRLRGQLDQALSERFSPIYRDLTEQYYRRLAQESNK